MKNLFQIKLLTVAFALAVHLNSWAAFYEDEPLILKPVIIKPQRCYFNGFVAGVGYSLIDGEYQSKNTDVFDVPNLPSSIQSKDAHLDAVDLYVGYGQQLNRHLYLGVRGGAQLYTKSNVDLLHSSTDVANLQLEDKFRARESGYADILAGLVIEDRLMLYPFVGYSNTKYVLESFINADQNQPVEYRNEVKWGTAYRFGLGAKYAFFPALSLDIHVLHQAPNHVTWPATKQANTDDSSIVDPVKHSLNPEVNVLSIGFEGYIN